MKNGKAKSLKMDPFGIKVDYQYIQEPTVKMNTSLETMSLIELKKLAKEKRIKQYYIKKRSELIELLTMGELPIQFKIDKMTIAELRETAKERGLRGFWSLHREELILVLFPKVQNTPANQKNNDTSKTAEHKDPQCHHPENVGI